MATLNQVTRPSLTGDGQHAPALRFGDARVMALMAAIAGFCHLIAGFDNRPRPADARPPRTRLLAQAGDLRPAAAAPQTAHRADPGAHRYQLTQTGRAVAVLFTKAYGRILGPGLAALDPRLPPDVTRNSPLALAWKQLTTQLDQFMVHGLAPA